MDARTLDAGGGNDTVQDEEKGMLVHPYHPSSSSPIRLRLSWNLSSFYYLLTVLLALGALAANLNYLLYKFWHYTKHVPDVLASPWLLLLLACECLYLFCCSIAVIDYVIPPITIVEHPSITNNLSLANTYPTVDIFFPCCKEPTDIPRDSILAALGMDYPVDRFRVVVLDDGGDDELKAFCEAYVKLNCSTAQDRQRPKRNKVSEAHGPKSDSHTTQEKQRLVYLRRTKVPGVPHHFKCGNLNFGLQHSEAEFVVMMDADMILHPSLLRRTLPHMLHSPEVSFVQIPQSFYNLPIGDPLNDACLFGYDRVLVHRDTMGYATCVGTGAIFRREHLDEIGGFQPQSITEDTMTAYTLFNRGYRSVYLNEKLQIGLTPWTFEAYVKQRQRWGQGAIQQFLASWKSMLGKGSKLSFPLKACYFWHTGYYYMSVLNVLLALNLLFIFSLNLRITIGEEKENFALISRLALYLVTWRIFWYTLWLEVPQTIQGRNRDESHFWWMTPFFFEMVVQAFYDYKSTFKFVPTSNIDRTAINGKSSKVLVNPWQILFSKKLQELRHVRVHLFFVAVASMGMIARTYVGFWRHGANDCAEVFRILGMLVFLIPVCAHMLVPVFHILLPTGFSPERRKSLLNYDKAGVPYFSPESDCLPKFHWSTIIYELLSYSSLVFWIVVLFIASHSGSSYNSLGKWCQR